MAHATHASFSKPLDGRHVVVVGGSSGIGRALAELVLRAGGQATIIARDPAKLAHAAHELAALGPIESASLDMMDEPRVDAWFSGRAAASIDHLVVTASTIVHGAFAELPSQAVRHMFDSKFFGPYTVARACLPMLGDGGSITFFSGVLSRRPGLNCSAAGAVNSAVEGLTRALALELGPRIRVNCCSPGMVRTEAYASMAEDERQTMYRATGASLPVARVGEPEEIAEAVLFMMTNGYMTGQVIDGGHTVRQYAIR
jgi:NAD(P)-dependent dehydrogenase (short-subunit alcohol dehydrogenase family)